MPIQLTPLLMAGLAAPSMEALTPPFTPRCYVSHAHRFIWILVAKNASSTLRGEFERDFYRAEERAYSELAPAVRREYFTFVFLRDPIERVLSAYQEVSFRADRGERRVSQMAFVAMPEGLPRFESFLDEINRHAWDGHVLPQARFVENARIDSWGSVENLQRDIAKIFSRLAIASVPELPQRRSRRERVARDEYPAHLLHRRELTSELVTRIRLVYREDEDLYQRVIRDADSEDSLKTDDELRQEIAQLRAELGEG